MPRGAKYQTVSRRQKISETMLKNNLKKGGWPDSIQKEGKPATYEEATWEWERRMAWSKSR